MSTMSSGKSTSEALTREAMVSNTTAKMTGEKEVFLPEEISGVRKDPSWQGKIARRMHTKNEYTRLFLAEFLGTFVLVAIGVACVAQAALNHKNFRLNIVGINLGWGLAVACGVYVSGGVSGGHINPAITVLFALFGRIKWRNVPIYLAAQYLGAFFASLCVYLIYYNQLNVFDGGIRQGPYTTGSNASSAGIFATYPQHDGIATWEGFWTSFRNYNWFWVPILGPHIGAILGGWLYNACVGLHMP